MRRLSLLSAIAFALLIAGAGIQPRSAFAATINVAAGEVAIDDNSLCSLREAIENANDDAPTHDDCATGSGADTINLPAGTYVLALDGSLPSIMSDIAIIGDSPATTLLDGTGTRHFNVPSSVTFSLQDMTVANAALRAFVIGTNQGMVAVH